MYSIAIHGGAGVADRNTLSSLLEKQYLQGLENALNAGALILKNGGASLDAVQASVVSLENNELFNAGRGSAFTFDSSHEMEASIMCGRRVDAGAVCMIRNVKNPIILARTVLEKSNHLFLCGKGAEKFALENRLHFEPDEYFFTPGRYEQLQEAKSRKFKSTGTVGAVALDNEGNLAAATSTGGLTNKNYGRVGDSPLVGAGTYANNLTCAVSCTGEGEYFIRGVCAYDISCLIEYRNFSLKQACEYVILEKLRKLGGEGGVIAVEREGNIQMTFNSPGMYRGFMKEGMEPQVSIY
jgi:beta-aspartyl-peptidase (threonine type)